MDLFSAAILLAIIMDPIGNIPLFHALLGHYPRRQRLLIIARELLIAYLVLVLFLLGGEAVLHWLGLQQPALGVAGGVVLFIIALRMVFPDDEAALPLGSAAEEPIVVPLAVPMLAGPSAVSALLLLVSRDPTQIETWLGALTLAWGFSAVILLTSGLLMEMLGPRALRALVRLMGMLLIMMAVQMFMDAISAYIAQLPLRAS
jgi:multiple antibiotic resistance protein